MLGGQNLYTNAVRRVPHTHTWKVLWCICFVLVFSLENKLFGIHQEPFLPVEAIELSELKTPLVYTFFLRNVAQISLSKGYFGRFKGYISFPALENLGAQLEIFMLPRAEVAIVLTLVLESSRRLWLFPDQPRNHHHHHFGS